jgi:hypothetical protein
MNINLHNFVTSAKEYISWVESNNSRTKRDMETVNELLLALYSNAFRLKYHPNADLIENISISHKDWKKIRESFNGLPIDEYQEIFDPLDLSDKSPVTASLSDDLADIYRDIKHALLAYEKGKTEEAEDDLRRNFEIHWGQHAISALKAIRQYFENN